MGELTCVGSSMSLEFITPCEPLSTEEPVADKGSLASVQADMGPKQRCLPESLSTVWDVAHVLLLALLPRPEVQSGGEEVGRGKGEKPWEVRLRLVPLSDLWNGCGFGPRQAHYLFSPSLQLGHVQAMRRRFSPGWASPARACSICSWIWVGLSPLMVRLFPDTFCTVSCCCPVGEKRASFRKGSPG